MPQPFDELPTQLTNFNAGIIKAVRPNTVNWLNYCLAVKLGYST